MGISANVSTEVLLRLFHSNDTRTNSSVATNVTLNASLIQDSIAALNTEVEAISISNGENLPKIHTDDPLYVSLSAENGSMSITAALIKTPTTRAEYIWNIDRYVHTILLCHSKLTHGQCSDELRVKDNVVSLLDENSKKSHRLCRSAAHALCLQELGICGVEGAHTYIQFTEQGNDSADMPSAVQANDSADMPVTVDMRVIAQIAKDITEQGNDSDDMPVR
jgi:hypothetical protein